MALILYAKSIWRGNITILNKTYKIDVERMSPGKKDSKLYSYHEHYILPKNAGNVNKVHTRRSLLMNMYSRAYIFKITIIQWDISYIEDEVASS